MGFAPEMVPLIWALGGRGSCGATPIKINVKKEDKEVVNEIVAKTADNEEEEEAQDTTVVDESSKNTSEKMDTAKTDEEDSFKDANEES